MSTSSFDITNNFHEVNKTNLTNPGKVVTKSNYCDWVWTVVNIKNNGPDAGNITIKDLGSSGFVYYNPSIKWNGWVLYNNGTGWIWDKNFDVTTGMGSYYIPSGETYQIAILGYINKTGSSISNSVYEVSQDDQGPAVYPSTATTISVPPAAIIKIYQEFRKDYNGSPTYNAEYKDYVYGITKTTNSGPDAANVIYKITYSGFTPTGTYAVSKDNGVTWTLNDGSFSFNNNEWSINLPSNACYLLAIYGQVTRSGTVTSNGTEIFQDVYNPYGSNNTKPKCVIVFDDGNEAQYSIAFKYMSGKGIIGTAYINGYDIGQTGVLTLSQLVEMNLAGWIIANHTFDHLVLTNLTDDQVRTEINNQINYLIANGFNSGAYHLAYPGGYINQHIIDILKTLGIQTGRTTQGDYIYNLNALDLYDIPAFTITNDTSVSTIKSYVDTAITNDSTIVLLFHNIKDSNPTTYDYLTNDFYSIIDYIAQSGIDCITMDDLYQLTSLPINIPSANSMLSTSSGVSDGYASGLGSIYVNPPKTDVGVTITSSNNKPNYLGYVTLTIKVTNYGPNEAYNVTVGDWLDGNYFKWISDDSNGAFNLSSTIWTVGTINVGETFTLNIVVQILASNMTINNTATYNSGTTEDTNLDNNHQTVSLVVPKATVITVPKVEGYKGDSKYLTATLTDNNKNPLSGKTVYFTINGKSVGSAVTDSNGVATLNYVLNNISGIYNIMAEFLQDADYSGVNGTTTLNILSIPTTITVNPVTGIKGDKVNLIATLNDTHNNVPIKEATIQYFINGNLVGTATTDNSGTATLLYTVTQNTGTYTIQALFHGDTTYLNTNNTNKLTVNISPTNLTVNPVNCYKNDKVNFTASLKDQNGNPVSGKTISFYGNGSLIGTATTDTNGTATLQYTMSVATGTYTLTAQFAQDTNYTSSYSTNTITVNLIPTKITINPINAYKGDNTNLNIILTDINGNPLNRKILSIYINGESIAIASTDNNGQIIIPYTIKQSAGTYTIQAIFPGDTTYLTSNNTQNLTVNLTSTSITTSSKKGYKGDKISITAILRDINKNVALSGKTILFTINGTNIGKAITNINGVASINYAIKQSAGSYNILTQFLSDSSYFKSSISGVLTVNPTSTSMVVNPIKTKNQKSVKLVANLKETHKNTLLSGKKVYFYINNKFVGSTVTNKSGVASLSYKVNLKTGKYNLTAKFLSDSNYRASTKSTKITVNK